MIKAIVTDIEGTTSSISFVKDVLFPYAAAKLPDFVRAHSQSTDVSKVLNALWAEEPELQGDIEASIQCLLTWIAQDLKRTPLKTLQGMLWKSGYEQGDYQAHVYPDAVRMLQSWHDQGLPLYIYSSGSIAAQKLFFRFSEAGDLLPLFSGHFDTTTGPKQSPESYIAITKQLAFPAEEILFLSDIPAELDAAKSAGMKTYLLVRPADTQLNTNDLAAMHHPHATSFEEIVL